MKLLIGFMSDDKLITSLRSRNFLHEVATLPQNSIKSSPCPPFSFFFVPSHSMKTTLFNLKKRKYQIEQEISQYFLLHLFFLYFTWKSTSLCRLLFGGFCQSTSKTRISLIFRFTILRFDFVTKNNSKVLVKHFSQLLR